jgi:DNA-directed RNA polymerase subunit alpha
MEISCRLYNFLKVANIMTLGEMAACTDYDLLRMKNFGRRTLDEAKTLLASYGLFLRARR